MSAREMLSFDWWGSNRPGTHRPSNLSSWLCIALMALVIGGCSKSSEPLADAPDTGTTPPPPGPPPPPPPPPPPMTSQAIFEATLYPVLIEPANFCVGCHGSGQDPTFATADATTAFNAITSQQKVDLANPELSRVYLRPKDERHNCGGDMSCDTIAAEVLAAVQDWANQAAAGGPPPTNGEPVVSAPTNLAAATAGGAARVDANTIALFNFSEGTGDVTVDSSNVGAPITLQIEGMEWVDGGGLRNVSGKAEANAADSAKLYDMISPVGEYTVEAWLIPENTAQDGPARIVTYSQDTAVGNFTMGQAAIYYQMRNSSVATGPAGTPALEALDPQVGVDLQHVAMTFDAASGRKIYINGQLSIEEAAADTLEWVENQLLVLGNEVSNDRLWQGEFRLVAIHAAALTGAEVQQNFDAGIGNVATLRFDVSGPVGTPAFIDFQVAQLDETGYMFANPVFVSDTAGIAVKNIRIAVNGGVPVAAQPFRRIDTIVDATGTVLSPLGAVIPVALGADMDEFHLEFEALADKLGLAEPVAPSTPPAPVADVMEPEIGLRTFDQINDTMSTLTGVNANQAEVLADFSELQGSLPATADLLTFASAQQIAIQRLATTYCGVVVTDIASCDAFFGACIIDVAAKDQVATTLYDRFIGDNLLNQPDRADVTTEIVSAIDDLGCAAGCNGATAEVALQATCAAVLSSAAMTLN